MQRACDTDEPLQRWKVIDAGDGDAMLVSQGNKGLCPDLYANSEAEVVAGTPIQVFSCWDAYTTEHWRRTSSSSTRGKR